MHDVFLCCALDVLVSDVEKNSAGVGLSSKKGSGFLLVHSTRPLLLFRFDPCGASVSRTAHNHVPLDRDYDFVGLTFGMCHLVREIVSPNTRGQQGLRVTDFESDHD